MTHLFKNNNISLGIINALQSKATDSKNPKKTSVQDTKQSDDKAPVMLELWGMQSISSLSSTLGPLWPRLIAPDRVQSMGQIKLPDI